MKIASLIITCSLVLLPALLSAQECVLTGSPAWTLPEKGEANAPMGGAVFVGAPLGNSIAVELGSPLSLVSQEAHSRGVFRGEGLSGDVNGFIELGGEGSTSKKTPFKFTVGSTTASDSVTSGEVSGILQAESSLDSSDCGALLTALYCGSGERTYQLTASVDYTPRAWAVRDAESSDWILLPGWCPPAARFTNVPEEGTCLEFVSMNEQGAASVPSVVCVGDTFGDSGTQELSDSDPSGGCRTNPAGTAGMGILLGSLLLCRWRKSYETV